MSGRTQSTASQLEAALRTAITRLPGLDAQLRMAPQPRPSWDPAQFAEGARDAAALLLLYPHAGDWHLPLTVRGSGLRSHTGQVSLPGGRLDPGESIESAALREAVEEIGVIAESVRVVGRMTAVPIPVSGYLLHPVVGIADARPDFRPAEWEVARLVEVPLSTLRDSTIVKRTRLTRHLGGRAEEIDAPYFAIDGEQVWGATAMVLAEFLALLDSISS